MKEFVVYSIVTKCAKIKSILINQATYEYC